MAFFLLVMFSRHFLASIVVKRFPVLNSFFFTILDLVEKWSLWPSTLNGRNFRFQQQKTNKVKYLPVTTPKNVENPPFADHCPMVSHGFPIRFSHICLSFSEALGTWRSCARLWSARTAAGVRAASLAWRPLARHLGMGNLAIFVGVLWEITGNSRGKRREIRWETHGSMGFIRAFKI